MTQIPSLATLEVAIGVNSTDWKLQTGQTLIDVTAYVEDYRTQSGKQHELDRFETGQLLIRFNNRLGTFAPFDTTTQSYNVLGGGTLNVAPATLVKAMNYVRIRATWSSTTYTVFAGFISSAQLVTPDEVNSEVVLTCEDPMKVLSTSRLLNDSLYPNLINAQNNIVSPSLSLTRCGDPTLSVGTLATSTGGVAPSFLGSANANQPGPFVYDDTTAIDLSNGTQTASGSIVYIDMNPTNTSGTEFYIEAWIKNAQTGDFLLSNYRPSNFQITGIGVDGDGHVRLQRRTLTSGSPTDVTLVNPHAGPAVNDGAWHLVGLQWASNTWTLFVDGQTVGTYADSTARLRILAVGAWITGTSSLPVGSYGTTATVANIAYCGIIGASITDQTPYVHDRYRVGSLLQDNTYTAQATSVSGTGSTATITCGGFVTGQTVTLSGFGASALNGSFLITAHTATTFSIASTVTSSTPGIVTLPYKTTGYRVLEALEVVGLIPVISGTYNGAPALSKSSGSGLYWNLEVGIAQTGAEQGTFYNRAASEVCLQASDTELGAFFWSASQGAFVFHDRFWWVRNKDAGAVATISDQTGSYARYISDVELVLDDLDLWTQVSITQADGTTTNSASANASALAPRVLTRSTDADSKITADAIGSTVLYRHQQQSIRVAKVTISSAAGSTNMATMLSTVLGDAVLFERRDAATAAYSQVLVVESKAHEFRADPGEWRVTYVLSPFEVYGSPYMTLDTTTIGVDGYFAAPFGG